MTEGLHAAVERALPLWSLSPATRVTLINQSENIVFRLDEPGGACLALRLHRRGYNDQKAIWSELAWITALRQADLVDTPAPVAGADGGLVQRLESGAGVHHAVAFQFVPGDQPRPGDDLGCWFGKLGCITATLHAHAQNWTRPDGFVRRRWDFPAMFGPSAVWGQWRDATGLDAAGVEVLAQGEALIRDRLLRYGQGADRFGLIHGDLRLTNLLVDGDRLQVIDFDDCGFGWFAHDFAAAVSFFEDSPSVPGLLEKWAAGYRQVRPLPGGMIAEMPVFVAARRLLLTAWLGTHPGAAAVGKDFHNGTVDVILRLLARNFL